LVIKIKIVSLTQFNNAGVIPRLILSKMEQRTETISSTTAGMLQINASDFDCEIIELGIAGGGKARITVRGTAENLAALFDYVNEAAE
jgi:hypothetical protein